MHLSHCIDCEWECKLGSHNYFGLLCLVYSQFSSLHSKRSRTNRTKSGRAKELFSNCFALAPLFAWSELLSPHFSRDLISFDSYTLATHATSFQTCVPAVLWKRFPVPGFRRVSFTVKVTWHFCVWFVQIDVLRKIMASLVCVTVIILTGSNYPIARNGGNGKWYFKINSNFFSIFCD